MQMRLNTSNKPCTKEKNIFRFFSIRKFIGISVERNNNTFRFPLHFPTFLFNWILIKIKPVGLCVKLVITQSDYWSLNFNKIMKKKTTVICLHCLGCNLNVIYAAQFATIANQIHALNNLEQAEAQWKMLVIKPLPFAH